MGLHSRREREAIMREIRLRRDGASQAFLREVRLPDDVPDEDLGHAADVPAARALRDGLALHPKVTFLVGENGAGKSTVLEAIAVACGMNAEGGGRHLRHATRESHSPLGGHLRVSRGARIPRDDFFLRAESLFTVATALDEMAEEQPDQADRILAPYGGRSLHERSHGESFVALLEHRFGPDGLYLLDEPESALSPANVLVLAERIVALAADGAQFVIATHSPLLLPAVPDARVVRCDADGLHTITADEAPAVVLTRRFLADPKAYLRPLLAEEAVDDGGAAEAGDGTVAEAGGRTDDGTSPPAEAPSGGGTTAGEGATTGAVGDDATGPSAAPSGPGGGFVRELCMAPGGTGARIRDEVHAPWIEEAVKAGVALHRAVTFLVGENGSGKSTLAEGIALAMKINPEGGGSDWWFRTRSSHSSLGAKMLVVRGRRDPPLNRFFLRAESVFTLATAIEQGLNVPEGGLEPYGDVSLHEQSHGESFLALVMHRLGPNGFFVLDEPEAALSPQSELALLRRIHDLVLEGGQLVIATHSPLLLAYPHATILRCDRSGVAPVSYDEAGPVVRTRALLRGAGRAGGAHG
ncbi:AAA family ATPase [Patulibacter sp. NPDC049589]|uniref:AAA family ATPase n=1 Tax=Patulibacter sp. NPDC049589 TaxID=3154731 RepID=UPI0034377341